MSIEVCRYKTSRLSTHFRDYSSVYKVLRNRTVVVFSRPYNQTFGSNMDVSAQPAHDFVSFLNASPTRRSKDARCDMG